MSSRRLEIILSNKDAKCRLDKVLVRHLDYSRSKVEKLFAEGRVYYKDKMAKPSLKLAAGDTVSLTLPEEIKSPLEAPPEPLEVLYEDDDLLLINKPQGLLVHPGIGQRDKTLVQAVEQYLGHLPDVGEVGREGIVHRLDQETSGGLIVAKTKAAFKGLKKQFQERKVKRIYLALCLESPPSPSGRITYSLQRDRRDPTRFSCTPGGREAITDYRLCSKVGPYSLLELSLKTGRTHQIRVHLRALGVHILGDKKYGGPAAELCPFLALHARMLGFCHPVTQEPMEFVAPLPENFLAVIEDEGQSLL